MGSINQIFHFFNLESILQFDIGFMILVRKAKLKDNLTINNQSDNPLQSIKKFIWRSFDDLVLSLKNKNASVIDMVHIIENL